MVGSTHIFVKLLFLFIILFYGLHQLALALAVPELLFCSLLSLIVCSTLQLIAGRGLLSIDTSMLDVSHSLQSEL